MIRGPIRLAVLVFGLACGGAVPLAFASEALQPWSGGATPRLRLKTLAGDELSLADFRGRIVIVNFWATWCGPCVAEMPSLQRLRENLAPDGLEVIAVNLKESTTRIAPFIERLQLTFPVVRDSDGATSRAWRVNVFPTSFVVGPDQRIAYVVRGEVAWDSAEVEAAVRRLIRSARPFPQQRSAANPRSVY
jgi:thiol-disulfide isomerase/thioredoxin